MEYILTKIKGEFLECMKFLASGKITEELCTRFIAMNNNGLITLLANGHKYSEVPVIIQRYERKRRNQTLNNSVYYTLTITWCMRSELFKTGHLNTKAYYQT